MANQHLDFTSKVEEGCLKDKETENQRGEQHNEALLLANPWKPWQRSRSLVKESLVWVRRGLGLLGGMEWYCFAALGVLASFLSFLMDLSVAKLLRAHQWLYVKLEGHMLLQFLCWTLYPVSLCALSSSFTHNICPFSAGSGVPEVRTMLSGVEMPHYLSVTNLFVKVVGLICTLAAGTSVFLGKVGPFVHLATMLGAYLNRLATLLSGKKEERPERAMLAVASAVGVASCFGTPISGVLFSVEVMSSHFPLRDYCPGFFAAACGAVTFRLLAVWSGEGDTVQPLFKTSFSDDKPFYPLEILAFSTVGLLCGAASCVYLFCHRSVLRLVKTNRVLAKMLTTEKALYSAMLVFLLSSITFPHSAGQYMASKYTMKELLSSLLDSRRWDSKSHNASLELGLELSPWSEWSPTGIPVHATLVCFLVMKLWMLVLACTLPIPAGYFMPVFVYGAALGRLVGETLGHVISEQGGSPINPGGYALAVMGEAMHKRCLVCCAVRDSTRSKVPLFPASGAAAMSGAVTHTLSPALVALEMTGQSSHAVPVILATLISNALSRSGKRPSFYDAISLSKKLPHLPSLLRACPKISSVSLGQVLGPRWAMLQRGAGPREVEQVLNTYTDPEVAVVESVDSPVLLGSVKQSDLQVFLSHTKDNVLKSLEDVCSIKSPSLQISKDTTVVEAHGVMSVMCAEILYVTERGRLVGVITWLEMKRIMENLAKDI
ncbi:chloride channel K [Hypomesus transpacificus]|uniref:chloride channel K n=1 Tax=Hypomesus transpacificus TaxID=137520 RepID=UPI001F07332C|nr:chloride channel K [Hypomesus transpacificus]